MSAQDITRAKRRCPDRNGDVPSLVKPSFTNFSERSALGHQIACWRHKLLEQYHKDRPDQVLCSQLTKSAQGISNASFRARKRFRQYPGQWEVSLKSKLGADSEATTLNQNSSKGGTCGPTTKSEPQKAIWRIQEETSSVYRGKHEETKAGGNSQNAKVDLFGRLRATFGRKLRVKAKVRRETALRHKFLSALASDYRGGPPQRSPFPEPSLRRIASGELWERVRSLSSIGRTLSFFPHSVFMLYN